MCSIHVGVQVPTDAQIIFNSSMSDEDFFKWLRLRGVNDKDCKTLTGRKILATVS